MNYIQLSIELFTIMNRIIYIYFNNLITLCNIYFDTIIFTVHKIISTAFTVISALDKMIELIYFKCFDKKVLQIAQLINS